MDENFLKTSTKPRCKIITVCLPWVLKPDNGSYRTAVRWVLLGLGVVLWVRTASPPGWTVATGYTPTQPSCWLRGGGVQAKGKALPGWGYGRGGHLAGEL